MPLTLQLSTCVLLCLIGQNRKYKGRNKDAHTVRYGNTSSCICAYYNGSGLRFIKAQGFSPKS